MIQEPHSLFSLHFVIMLVPLIMTEKKNILTRIFKAEGNFRAALFWNTACCDNRQYSSEKSLHSAEPHSLFSCSCLADISDPIQFPLSQKMSKKNHNEFANEFESGKMFAHTKSMSIRNRNIDIPWWETCCKYVSRFRPFFKTHNYSVCLSSRKLLGTAYDNCTFYDVCGIFHAR